jgi:hypothetical protein
VRLESGMSAACAVPTRSRVIIASFTIRSPVFASVLLA